MKEKIRLGEALVNAGLIDDFQLQSALGKQREWGGRLGKSLIELGFLDEATLIKFLSEKLAFPAIDLSRSHIAEKTFEALPKNVAEKYMTVPILIKDTHGKKTLLLAMADPTDLRAIDDIEFITNYKIESVVALESAILNVLANYGAEHIGEPEGEPEPIKVEEQTGRVEVVHGDMDMLDEVRKAEAAPEAPAAEASAPAAVVQGEEEFDLSPPPLEAFEEATVPVQEDSPLEMIAEEPGESAEDVIEDAEVLEEIEPVEETAEIVELEEVMEAQPVEEEEGAVAVVESIEELAAMAGGGAARAPEEIEAHAEVEPAEAFEAVEDIEEIEAAEVSEEIEAAEPVAEAEAIEALEEVEAGEVIGAGEEIEATEVEAIEEEAEEIAEAEAVEEEPAEVVELVAETASLQDAAALRADLARLKDKVEGLVSLFILHMEGKLSLEEFIEELRNL